MAEAVSGVFQVLSIEPSKTATGKTYWKVKILGGIFPGGWTVTTFDAKIAGTIRSNTEFRLHLIPNVKNGVTYYNLAGVEEPIPTPSPAVAGGAPAGPVDRRDLRIVRQSSLHYATLLVCARGNSSSSIQESVEEVFAIARRYVDWVLPEIVEEVDESGMPVAAPGPEGVPF